MNRTPHYHLLPALLIALTTVSAMGAKPVPKAVVSILVDQLRSDYMEAFMPLYGEGGLRRLMREGVVCSDAESPSAAADRAALTASILTGTTPQDHGIISSRWLDRETLRPMRCTTDPQHGLSAARLAVSTIGDELKVATGGSGKVVSIAPDADVAILCGGHAADAALWLDEQTGDWTSTSYYGELPPWAQARNRYFPLEARLDTVHWRPSSYLAGNFSYFLSRGPQKPFNHVFTGAGRIARYKQSGLVNEEVLALCRDCIRQTAFGMDEQTDFLAVGLYAGNYAHKAAAEAPAELQDTYVRLDRVIEALIAEVEEQTGRGGALFVLTSTGADEEETPYPEQYRIPSGSFDMAQAASLLNMYLAALYGQGEYVHCSYDAQIYLNRELISHRQLPQAELLVKAQEFLLQLEGVRDVYTSERLLSGAWMPGMNRIRAGYNQQLSGDIMLEIRPGWRLVNKVTGEDRIVRASYVSLPLIFCGAGIAPQQLGGTVSLDRVAPTLARAMRIRAPNACNAPPLDLGP